MTPNPVRPESEDETDEAEAVEIRAGRDFSQRAHDVVRKATERFEDDEDE